MKVKSENKGKIICLLNSKLHNFLQNEKKLKKTRSYKYKLKTKTKTKYLKDFQVGALSTLYFTDGQGSFGGSFFLQESAGAGLTPPTFQSLTNVVGINWATADAVGKGWSVSYNVNVGTEERNLIALDSSTSTLLLAILSTFVAFGSTFFF